MLEHTFLHLPGIGSRTERMLWEKGVLTWEDFLDHPGPLLAGGKESRVRRELERSLERRNDPSFFAPRLPPTERWRLYEAFQDRVVFLDIETSGMGTDTEEITLVGLYDGHEVQTFVSGKNLQDCEEALARFGLMVTFNGSCFDLPFLRKAFRHIAFPPVHIDLRFVMKKLGLRGGLKSIEKRLGLLRDPQVRELDGWDAVWLWRAYQGGEEKALDLLILYNTQDIVHLKPLMEWAAQEMKRRLLHPFG